MFGRGKEWNVDGMRPAKKRDEVVTYGSELAYVNIPKNGEKMKG
jgi:hypothetical protein